MPRDALCALLGARLAYAAGEADAVYLEHLVRVEYPHASARPTEGRVSTDGGGSTDGGDSGGRVHAVISSSLVGYGDATLCAGGSSMMSRCVGLSGAVGVHAVLSARGRLAGVRRPNEPEIYERCLPMLAAEGLRFEETVHPL